MFCDIKKFKSWVNKRPKFPSDLDTCLECKEDIGTCFNIIQKYIEENKKNKDKIIKN